MTIPYHCKRQGTDLDCAAVCLQMALDSFGHTRRLDAQFYELIGALGPKGFTLPWGICKGAAEHGLMVTFISENPFDLLQSSYAAVSQGSHLPEIEVRRKVGDLIKYCKHRHELITLRRWEDRFEDWTQQLVNAEGVVVIPTIMENTEAHNVVLTEWGRLQVRYHDPNPPPDGGPNKCESTSDFLRRWRQDGTDHDVLVISNRPLAVPELS